MITQEQFEYAASLIGCEVAVIKAVYEVEANGAGFIDEPDPRIKILFEGHRFWKNLIKAGADPAAFIKKHPEYSNVLYKKWTKKNYKGGRREWDRMSQAIQVCQMLGKSSEVALKSASYGAFQIMGENHALCGYDSAQQMISKYNMGGEAEQLNSFILFIEATFLDDELRAKNWGGFAKGYNGTAYLENKYDTKLAATYKKHASSR